MKIGFTGTQIGMSIGQQQKLETTLIWYKEHSKAPHEFHHGDCIGADEQADVIARRIGYVIHIHPGHNRKRAFCDRRGPSVVYTPAPYLERNKRIVLATEELIAAPKDEHSEELRSGTWATIRFSRKMGKSRWIMPR